MTQDRRHFTRIHFQSAARLVLPGGEHDAEVVDLSLKGALLRPAAGLFVAVGSNGSLEIPLDDAGAAIRMEVTVVHREGNYIGLACREIDLDSISHLRRLVELNIGDAAVLERELTALAKAESR